MSRTSLAAAALSNVQQNGRDGNEEGRKEKGIGRMREETESEICLPNFID